MEAVDKIRSTKRVRLKIIIVTALILSFTALLLDSLKTATLLLRFLKTDPEVLAIIALSVNLIGIVLGVSLSKKFLKFNNFFFFPVTASAAIALTFVEHLTYSNYVYKHFFIYFDRMTFLAICSGITVLINLPKSFLLRNIRDFIFFGVLVFLFVMVLVRLWPNDVFLEIVKEDHLIENSQVIMLLTGAFFSLLISRRFFISGKIFVGLMFCFITFFFIFISGEEIAWGQRLLHFAAPGYFLQDNTQKEVTLHNLKQVVSKVGLAYTMISFYGVFGWVFSKQLKMIFKSKNFTIFLPPFFTFFYFLSSLTYNLYTITGGVRFGEWSEVSELILYTGLMLIVANGYFLLRKI